MRKEKVLLYLVRLTSDLTYKVVKVSVYEDEAEALVRLYPNLYFREFAGAQGRVIDHLYYMRQSLANQIEETRLLTASDIELE